MPTDSTLSFIRLPAVYDVTTLKMIFLTPPSLLVRLRNYYVMVGGALLAGGQDARDLIEISTRSAALLQELAVLLTYEAREIYCFFFFFFLLLVSLIQHWTGNSMPYEPLGTCGLNNTGWTECMDDSTRWIPLFVFRSIRFLLSTSLLVILPCC